MHAVFYRLLSTVLKLFAAGLCASVGAQPVERPPADTAPNTAAAAAPAPAASVPASAASAPAKASVAEITAVLQKPLPVLEGLDVFKGTASLKGKRFYVSEYRVLFETGGSVSANSRPAYFGGTNYGGTNVKVEYKVPELDMAVLQAITDRAYADFVARLEAGGTKPEPADTFIRELGAVYEASAEASKPGAAVTEEVDLGFGKRRYLVLSPTGMKLNARGMTGLGMGNIGNRINFVKLNVDAISVGMAVNLAAQETSGSGSSLFRRGSSANASAAMEVTSASSFPALLGHGGGGAISFTKPLAVPGQFATLRETGGYDSKKDMAAQSVQLLGRFLGVASNQIKQVELTVDVDQAAMASLALQGLMSFNQGLVSGIK